MVKPDLDAAIRFLRALRPRGPWTLTALFPDGNRAPTKTYIGASEVDAMRAWIQERNQRFGVYFVANPTRQRLPRRPKESDMLAYQYAALDFDPLKDESPADCRARVAALLNRYRLPPTFWWSTGNGVQALWRVKPAVRLNDKLTIVRCRRANLGLIQELGSDTTQSMEHLFRLPGTVNYPNKVKLKAGRKVVRAGDFKHMPGNVYSIDDFPEPKQKTFATTARGLAEPPGGWDTTEGVDEAILYFRMTEDVAAEGRSGTAIRVARRARDYGVSKDHCFELMQEYWVPRCEYEWDDDELLGKVTRAYANAANDPGCRTAEYLLLEAREDFAS